jgi:AhpD family alkylhydroperoxidase
MPRLSLPTIETAPEEAKPRLQACAQEQRLPAKPRADLLSNAPVALETYQTVGAINARSGLSLAEREAVQITAAAVHGCGFCVAGHTAVAYKQAKLSRGRWSKRCATAQRCLMSGWMPSCRIYARRHPLAGRCRGRRARRVSRRRLQRGQRARSRARREPRHAVQLREQSRRHRSQSRAVSNMPGTAPFRSPAE